jgi:apolipoprotein N-acyltransferase
VTGFGVAAAARIAAWPRHARWPAALAAGGLAAAALPPVHALPLLVVAFAVLLWLIDGAARARGAAFHGWLFGVGFFGVGLAWLGNAFMVDAERFGAFAVPAVVGLACGLGLFPAMVAAVAHRARAGWCRALTLALAWTVAEWLRGHMLTGFPWNLLATVWEPFAAPAQAAALVGAYGVGLVTALIAILPAVGRRGPLVAGVLLGLLWGGGGARIALTDTPADGPWLRVVQGNVAQHHKWRDDLRREHLERYIALSRGPAATPPSIIVWPETAVPYFLTDEPDLLRVLGTLVPAGGYLITGAVRRSPTADGALALFNSVHAIAADGTLAATYDKAHLVPFGEYTPLRSVLSRARLVPGGIDFSAGPGLVTWRLPGLPGASPLVCYEAIFPGRVARTDDRPDWLLNVTNDAWFGISGGPYQHLATARLRAIEEGLPLVRAANTGISAVIDPLGRTVAALRLGGGGVIDVALPGPLAPTPYGRFGDWLLGGLIAGLAVAAGCLGSYARRTYRD